MRSPAEIAFRLKQESANLYLFLNPPEIRAVQPAPLPGLPDPAQVIAKLKGSPYAQSVEEIAHAVLAHRIPLLGYGEYPFGAQISWRRDDPNDIESDAAYFRRVPYLDFGRTGDHKFIWELNRHQFLVTLAQAWRFTGRRDYLQAIPTFLQSWEAQNAYMCGINWTSALEVAFRVHSWAWAYHLCAGDLESDFRQHWLELIYRHGLYLEHNLSVYFSPNTHLLGEAVILHALGRWFPMLPRARRWIQQGARVTVEQMRSQVRADGSHFEQSTYYHVYALDFFLLHGILNHSVPDWYRERLRAMASFLHAILPPSGLLPFFGDDDGGRLFHPYGDRRCFALATLATCSAIFDEPLWLRSSGALEEQAEWWVDRQAPVPVQSQAEPARFPDSGIAVMTSGDIHVVIDAGPLGSGSGGHSHADTLSLIVNAGDEEILIDPGTFTYVSDPVWRNRFRGTGFHNTIQVNDWEQATPVNIFRWSNPPAVEVRGWDPRRQYLDAVCRYREITHRRAVLLDPRGWLCILDRVEGPQGEHLVRQFWHAGADVKQLSPERYRIGRQAQIIFPEQAQAAVEDGWRSLAFGSKQPSPVIVARKRSRFPILMAAVVTFGVDVKSIQLTADALLVDDLRVTFDKN